MKTLIAFLVGAGAGIAGSYAVRKIAGSKKGEVKGESPEPTPETPAE